MKTALSLTLGACLCLLSLATPAVIKINAYIGVSYPHYNYSPITMSGAITTLKDDINDATIMPGLGIGYAYIFQGEGILNKIFHDATISIDYYNERSKDNGQVLTNGTPNADYSMTFNTNRLMLNTEVGFDFPLSGLIPYLQAAVGPAQTISNYSQTANTDSGATFYLPKQTQTKLAWSLGVGCDATLSKHVHLGLGYLYTHFGHANLSTSGNGNPIDQPLSMRVYSNTALFNLMFLIGN